MSKPSKALEILEVIKEALEKHPEFGELTPIMYDPHKLHKKPCIGLMETVGNKTGLSLMVSVEDLYEDRYKDE
jgi:hypothetical protein